MPEQSIVSADMRENNISISDVRDFESLLGSDLEQVKKEMQLIASHSLNGTQVGAVLDDAFSTAGKMIRPRLVLLSGSFGPFYEVKIDKLFKLAAMIELTHLASLIHDDIVDDAPFRRGERSVQSKYGKDAAVYAGDFIICRINYTLARENMNEAAAVLSQTIEHMCEGEIGQAMCRYREDVSTDDYLWNIQGKTTALFKAACQLGASEMGCSKETVSKLSAFGECLGTMFQLRDDLLDFTSDEAQIGKETHKDFRDGIYTMPVLMTLKDPEGRKVLLPIIQENSKHRISDSDIARMEEAVVRYGGTDATVREIRRMSQRCLSILGSLDYCAAVQVFRNILKLLYI